MKEKVKVEQRWAEVWEYVIKMETDEWISLSFLYYRTEDCVNGTLVDSASMPGPWINLTTFLNLYDKSLGKPVDPTNAYLPSQRSLTIYNTSRLYINLEGCVNTLRGECRDFLQTHGRDGDNQTAQSRYPCFHKRVIFQIFILEIFIYEFYHQGNMSEGVGE